MGQLSRWCQVGVEVVWEVRDRCIDDVVQCIMDRIVGQGRLVEGELRYWR